MTSSENNTQPWHNCSNSKAPVGEVACTFVGKDQVLNDAKSVEWERENDYGYISNEMVEFHVELINALEGKSYKNCVKHLGENVYAQLNKYGLDRDSMKDSPITITREANRSVVKHALDALESEFAVYVTGQPGMGKTRGCMMYAIQTLLYEGAAVLYVGYKSEKMILFLPGEDGKYPVWRTLSTMFSTTMLKLDSRMVEFISPPEEGTNSSMGECRVLKFVSNNSALHFRAWEKYVVLLVTSMPTKEEVIAMTPVIWNENETPHECQVGKLNTTEEKVAEVSKRIELVGPIPRHIFKSQFFRKAVTDCRGSAPEAAERISDFELYEDMLGKYTPFVEKHPVSVTRKIFHLLPEPIRCEKWKKRMRISIEPVLQLSAVSKYELPMIDFATSCIR